MSFYLNSIMSWSDLFEEPEQPVRSPLRKTLDHLFAAHAIGFCMAPFGALCNLSTAINHRDIQLLKTGTIDLFAFIASMAPYALAIGTGNWAFTLANPNLLVTMVFELRLAVGLRKTQPDL